MSVVIAHRNTSRALARRTLASLGLACALCVGAGCEIAGLASVMVESYKRSSTRLVPAEYRGLEGKNFAVIVSADRVIQSDNPNLVSRMQVAISERLREHAGGAGYVPPDIMLAYLGANPRWAAKPFGDIAEELGVERLIIVELLDFRLHEPGNPHIWNGAAAATVGVIEADGPLPDEFLFRSQQRVMFPDGDGYGPLDFSASFVSMRLQTRLLDRVTWLFYDHQEPYYPSY
ncbi:MAG: hypothetical protein EA379_01905 [Phycisphaerales bacterium]|nr:MAG: hypothetical protein EA379_01905 [Phycisphaerales bacterium]